MRSGKVELVDGMKVRFDLKDVVASCVTYADDHSGDPAYKCEVGVTQKQNFLIRRVDYTTEAKKVTWHLFKNPDDVRKNLDEGKPQEVDARKQFNEYMETYYQYEQV